MKIRNRHQTPRAYVRGTNHQVRPGDLVRYRTSGRVVPFDGAYRKGKVRAAGLVYDAELFGLEVR